MNKSQILTRIARINEALAHNWMKDSAIKCLEDIQHWVEDLPEIKQEMTLEDMKKEIGMTSWWDFYLWCRDLRLHLAYLLQFQAKDGRPLRIRMDQVKANALDEIYEKLPDTHQRQKLIYGLQFTGADTSHDFEKILLNIPYKTV